MGEVLWNIFRYLYIYAISSERPGPLHPPSLSIHPKHKLQLVVPPKKEARAQAQHGYMCFAGCAYVPVLPRRTGTGRVDRDGKRARNGIRDWPTGQKRGIVDGPHLSARGFKQNLCT